MGNWLNYYVHVQEKWSRKTFGSARRTKGLIDHIQKELKEIENDPTDLKEWIDIMILAMDGYWRHGGRSEDLMRMLQDKQRVNISRKWPQPISEDKAVEHIREDKLD